MPERTDLDAQDVVAQVEALAQTLYEEAMGRNWPVPYTALAVSEQEEWRGSAYCATYALALCPVTKAVHPWLRSWCAPSCYAPSCYAPAPVPAGSARPDTNPKGAEK